ncbi:MAG: molecular chaperone DnaJ [candidate division Zixibacteria bacterium HGW-Zixibacteria-1]|nr:MAG: molecular chaperone DnaJ [candidate division Zixibacteria bacterium HGW-Zixibacteria-1]
MPKNYYTVLGVPENASKEDIKKAFRTLAKKFHPDRNKGEASAEARFKEISEAYEILGDEQKRGQYDTMRKYGAFGGFDHRQARGGAQDSSQFGGNFRFEDLGGLGSFADIFSSIFGSEDLFGGRSRKHRAAQPHRGAHLSLKLNVSFKEAINGTSKTLRMNKPVTCDVCGGTGEQKGSGQKVCTQCNGRGTVSYAQGGFSISRPCPRCLGKGLVPGTPCGRCGGSGRVKESKKIKIKIPAGIDDGGIVRLRGLGNPGSNGGHDGDLLITVNVNKNQQFERKGNDIYTTVEVSYPQAVLGAKVPVKTLAKMVNINVKPGTTHGTKLRLKGMGLSVDGAQGDQYVEVHIGVPSDITPRQKELLEELQKTMQS